jgi:hypothetical protein
MTDITQIAGIPTAITDNHNEVLPYWKTNNAPLLHIDAHHDLWDVELNYQGELIEGYIKKVTMSNFICPAVHCKVISDIYWLNPHMGGGTKFKYYSAVKKKLDTIEDQGYLRWKRNKFWRRGSKVKINKVSLDQPYILDIDLDAFSCKKNHLVTLSHNNPEQGYELRIEQTMESLSKLPIPKLITITRSNGKNIPLKKGYRCEFVPPSLQEIVEQLTLEGLKEVYN